jgi:hypothetical protein
MGLGDVMLVQQWPGQSVVHCVNPLGPLVTFGCLAVCMSSIVLSLPFNCPHVCVCVCVCAHVHGACECTCRVCVPKLVRIRQCVLCISMSVFSEILFFPHLLNARDDNLHARNWGCLANSYKSWRS